MSAPASTQYDVIFFDRVGMPYVGASPRLGGLGGSEHQVILLAEALVRVGISVLVMNTTLETACENGVEYVHHAAAQQTELACRTLIVCRYSPLPPISRDRVLIWATDVPGNAYHHLQTLFSSDANALLVTVSQWQRSLFPATWSTMVVPNMLEDAVYRQTPLLNPRRFVYASAALKGLRQTVETWNEIANGLRDVELVVCTPGYDTVDPQMTSSESIRFVGSLPFHSVVEQIAGGAGLFYVNVFAETFCIVAALAEALGRRAHILCLGDRGGLGETVRGPLLSDDLDTFRKLFLEALETPSDPRWYPPPRDFRVSQIFPLWLELLAPKPRLRPVAVKEPPAATRICLNMIVRNEAHVIGRCLDSVRPFVQSWVIVDTGSTDGTQELIRRHLSSVPGELHERTWTSFAHNRNQAIELACGEADYLLVIDADDVLQAESGFVLPQMTHDVYELRVEDGGTSYYRPHIFRPDCGSRYHGVLHEYLSLPPHVTRARMPGLVYRRLGGGARSTNPQRYRQDAEMLETELSARPQDGRAAFYLAQSWRDAGEVERALAAYSRRARMGGWDEEVWFSLFEVARLSERLGCDEQFVVSAYLRAFEFRPCRAEPLCELARFYRLRRNYALGRLFARAAMDVPRPGDRLFIDDSVYDWRALDEYATNCYYVGGYQDALQAYRQVLESAKLPAWEQRRIQANVDFCMGALQELPRSTP